MRRTLALAAAMLLLPLAACGDSAGQSAGPSAPATADGATSAPTSAGSDAGAEADEPGGPVLGGWGNLEDSSAPSLEFGPDGTYSGTDGCNGMAGNWREDGGRVILDPGPMTLKGCPDIDTWLRDAASVEPADDVLAVFNAEGLRIGELTR
ncbi:META domain protein [Arthrobacter saudimassiliensis]|uniref:META domain protein n=1 Tax=Arthrobacter saudimassiliensis TaxID=1461584 RepID=A0A078MVH3_9MICC|nr:META domain protein [Arthrobacter saudimassiliensis]